MLHLQDERQWAMDDVTDNVCRPGLATGVPDEAQYIVKKGAKACNVLANWAWPCPPLRPRCRHDAAEAADAAPEYRLVERRL